MLRIPVKMNSEMVNALYKGIVLKCDSNWDMREYLEACTKPPGGDYEKRMRDEFSSRVYNMTLEKLT